MADTSQNPVNPYARQYLLDYLGCIRQKHEKIQHEETGVFQNRDAIVHVSSERLYVEPAFSKHYIDPQSNPDTREQLYKLEDLLEKYDRLFILGDPGIGKTTLINRISYLFSAQQNHQLAKRYGYPIPLPLILRDLDYSEVNSWEDLLGQFFSQDFLKKITYRPDEIRPLLENGQAFVLLDGLDEVSEPETRKKLAKILHRAVQDYPRSRWWITSRLVGFDQHSFWHPEKKASEPEELYGPEVFREKELSIKKEQEFDEVFIAPFKNEQIQRFLFLWGDVYFPEEKESFAENFYESLKSHPRIYHLARIPNVLSMMCLYYRVNQHLPDGRFKLYKEIAEIYMYRLREMRKQEKPPLSLDEQKRALAHIALEMQRRRTQSDKAQLTLSTAEVKSLMQQSLVEGPNISADQGAEAIEAYLETLQLGSAVLIPRSADAYGFLHLSYQEYFAAEALRSRFDHLCTTWGGGEEAERAFWQELQSYARNENTWGETLLLFFESFMVPGHQKVEACRYAFAKLFDWQPEKPEQLIDINYKETAAHILTDESICSSDWDEQSRKSPLFSKEEHLALLDFLIVQGSFFPKRTPIWQLIFDWGRKRGLALFLAKDTRIAEGNNYRWVYGEESSSLTDKELDELGIDRLSQVRWLHLGRTPVSDLAPLEKLTGLRWLDLRRTPVSDLAPLEKLTELERLDLSGTPVSDLAPLEKLTGLERLDLSGTPVSDLAPLEKLTGLEGLDLRDTPVSDLAPLEKLTGLRWLDLRRTPVSDLAPLEKLARLERLHLGRTPVSDLAPLEKLTGLRVLYLNDAQVSDLAPLEKLTRLKGLELNNTPVSDLAPLEKLTGLRVLYLNDAQVSDLASRQPAVLALLRERKVKIIT